MASLQAMHNPTLIGQFPGFGGRLKTEPEDFQVEEIPTFPPDGEGQHLYLWIEKIGLPTDALVRHLAATLGLDAADIGFAGMKDAQAVTRQFISVPASCEGRLAAAQSDAVQILEHHRSTTKLRRGELRGNRFDILVRDSVSDALHRAEPIVAALRERGMPNYFGKQRFGIDGQTVDLGLRLLNEGPKVLKRGTLKRMALSAVQSVVFNDVLNARLRSGELGQVVSGEVIQSRIGGSLHRVIDVAREQGRLDAKQAHQTGPMFGTKMMTATGAVGELEMRMLQDRSLQLDQFEPFSRLAPGTRRALVVWPQELSIEPDPQGIRLRFVLPAGAYATVLCETFMGGEKA